jgi:hypothetical protein
MGRRPLQAGARSPALFSAGPLRLDRARRTRANCLDCLIHGCTPRFEIDGDPRSPEPSEWPGANTTHNQGGDPARRQQADRPKAAIAAMWWVRDDAHAFHMATVDFDHSEAVAPAEVLGSLRLRAALPFGRNCQHNKATVGTPYVCPRRSRLVGGWALGDNGRRRPPRCIRHLLLLAATAWKV